MQRKIKQYTKRSRKYKQAFVRKVLSTFQIAARIAYAEQYVGQSFDECFKYVMFTDEAHIDPTSQRVGQILREEGTRYDDENIQRRVAKSGSRFHIAASVSWYHKGKLMFYNDEEDHTERPSYPPRPRRRPTTETGEEYDARVREWDAGRPHEVEVRVGGNHMTQKYYVDNLLPQYVSEMHQLRENYPGPWLIQKNGDGSHGIRKPGLAYALKNANSIENFTHPANSPDLNLIKIYWNIIKQRLRRQIYQTDAELRETIQREWDVITIKKIRNRIETMPDRCKQLLETSGAAIKSALW